MFAVESQIVGYATTDTVKNAQAMIGAQFMTVGSEALDIQSITPIGEGIEDGCAWIKWWDTTSKTYSEMYSYFTEVYDADGNGLGYPGWGDGEYWIPVEKTFAPGEGFWFQANVDNVSFQAAGEVYQPTTEYYSIPLVKNAQKMVMNPFPTALNIQDIVMDGAGVEDGCAWIKWWDTTTKTYSEMYSYFTEVYDADGNGLGYPGWGDGEYWIPVEKIFDTGVGFWIQANVDNLQVAFPNPFYVAPVK